MTGRTLVAVTTLAGALAACGSPAPVWKGLGDR